MELSEPTVEQCSERAMLALPGGKIGYACWYPSMGGYGGRCIVIPDGAGGVDAYVWHDGEFPFTGDDPHRESTNPREVHHCSGDDFIAFGQFMNEINGG